MGLWAVVSLYGDSKELWKTGCTRQVFRRTNLLLVMVVETTLKGPCCWGANLALGCVVWMFVPSNQTRSPVWNTWDGVLGLVHFMMSEATSRVAITSGHTWFMVHNRSSTVGMVVVNLAGGLNSGRYPYQTSNGDFPVALWACALWANSMNGSKSAQLLTWKSQNTRRYCSNS